MEAKEIVLRLVRDKLVTVEEASALLRAIDKPAEKEFVTSPPVVVPYRQPYETGTPWYPGWSPTMCSGTAKTKLDGEYQLINGPGCERYATDSPMFAALYGRQ